MLIAHADSAVNSQTIITINLMEWVYTVCFPVKITLPICAHLQKITHFQGQNTLIKQSKVSENRHLRMH